MAHTIDRIMRQPEVLRVLGCSRWKLRTLIQEGKFPAGKSDSVGGRPGWLESKVQEYIRTVYGESGLIDHDNVDIHPEAH